MSRLDSLKDAAEKIVSHPLRTLGVLAVAGVAALSPGEADAQTTSVGIESLTPAENLVGWRGAHSANATVRATIEDVNGMARRLIVVETTPGAQFELQAECPPPSLNPGWDLVRKSPAATGRASAEIYDTGDGTFNVGMRASDRADLTMRFSFSCVENAVDETGRTLTGSDAEIVDTEILDALVTSRTNITKPFEPRRSELFHGSGSGVPPPAAPSGSSRAKGAAEGQVEASALAVTNTKGDPEIKPGFGAELRANLGKGWARFLFGGRYGFAEVREDAYSAHGGKKAVDDSGKVHALTGEVGWNPGSDAVRGLVAVNAGGAHAEKYRTGAHTVVEGENGFTAGVRAAVEVALTKAKDFGLKAEAEGTTGTLDSFNNWKIGGGAFWRFQ
jgi:hypothetical protein